MVPPHGLQKLKAAPYQFLSVKFTRFILPVNGMCAKANTPNISILSTLNVMIIRFIRYNKPSIIAIESKFDGTEFKKWPMIWK